MNDMNTTPAAASDARAAGVPKGYALVPPVRMLTEDEVGECFDIKRGTLTVYEAIQRKCAEVWGLSIGAPPSAAPVAMPGWKLVPEEPTAGMELAADEYA